MQERSKIHVGLDVHKDSISIAAAEPGRVPGRLIGKVTHDVNKLLKVLTKIGSSEQLHIVYEAGPTGFGLQRALRSKGYLCEIIAPSQIPRRACAQSGVRQAPHANGYVNALLHHVHRVLIKQHFNFELGVGLEKAQYQWRQYPPTKIHGGTDAQPPCTCDCSSAATVCASSTWCAISLHFS